MYVRVHVTSLVLLRGLLVDECLDDEARARFLFCCGRGSIWNHLCCVSYGFVRVFWRFLAVSMWESFWYAVADCLLPEEEVNRRFTHFACSDPT